MNDPGLDEAVESELKQVDVQLQYDDGSEVEAMRDQAVPISTGIPLVAGTFGPMSNAFSICALVQPWRARVPAGKNQQTSEPVKDPAWLLIVNAVSLVLAVLANAALLLNMARRITSAAAQPIIIVGWYLASFLLLGLVVAAPLRLRLPSPPDLIFTQAYYYALMAAVLYFIVASLMLVTLYGAWKGHHSREFKLTASQRTLMLQTIVFLGYLLAAAAVYARLERWPYLDAVYWALATLLTVGFGDFTPKTSAGRGLLIPFSAGGTVIIGLVIGSIRSLVLERGKEKMEGRMMETKRQAALAELAEQKRRIRLGLFAVHRVSVGGGGGGRGRDQLQQRQRRASITESAFARAHAAQLSRQEFRLMRRLQDVAARDRRWTSLVISFIAFLLLWFLAALVFQRAEGGSGGSSSSANGGQGWSFFDALYFAFVALLTIGYGDLRVQSSAGTAFFVFWSLLAVPAMTILVSNMGDTIVRGVRDVTLWVGAWTLLPDERGVRATLKQSAQRLTGGGGGGGGGGGRGSSGSQSPHSDGGGRGAGGGGDSKGIGRGDAGAAGSEKRAINYPGGGGGGSGDNDGDSAAAGAGAPKAKASQVQDVAGELGARENRAAADAAGARGEAVPRDTHCYLALLTRELRAVLRHLDESPPHKYTYDEWARYLKLIGEDGRVRPLVLRQEQQQKQQQEQQQQKEGQQAQLQKRDGAAAAAASDADDEEEARGWSWLDLDSPLMSDKSEPRWLFEKLLNAMEQQLKKLREEGQADDKGGKALG